MTYKTIVLDYAPRAKKMADAVEKKANEMAREGWELATFSVTGAARAILVFRTPENLRKKETDRQEASAT